MGAKKFKFKKLEEIEIVGTTWKITWSKKIRGANFDWADNSIGVSTYYLKRDPEYVYMMLMHEISEIIHALLGTRYDDSSVKGNYKFFMDHKAFSNHNVMLSNAMIKFLH